MGALKWVPRLDPVNRERGEQLTSTTAPPLSQRATLCLRRACSDTADDARLATETKPICFEDFSNFQTLRFAWSVID